MPLVCTETGAIISVQKKYRKNYLKDITEIGLEQNIPLVLWDYDQNFAVSTQNKKVVRYLKYWIKENKHSQ